MNNLGLYLAAVLIWGSTWYAITFQLRQVPAEVSVAYRFALAGVLLLLWCGVRRLRLAYSWREHRWMAAQGALLFGLNYVCVYLAEEQIASGLVAVTFSLVVLFNLLGARYFFGTPLKLGTLAGAAFGLGGVALVFLPEIGTAASQAHATLGLGYALVATISASLGSLVAARNQRHGLPVIQLNTSARPLSAAATPRKINPASLGQEWSVIGSRSWLERMRAQASPRDPQAPVRSATGSSGCKWVRSR
jgi:drug/metabolite transporter (DMT)-like permease